MPPLFPLLIAFCLRAFSRPDQGLELIQALLSSLVPLMIYLITLRLSSNQLAALVAAAGVAAYPVFIVMSAYPLSLTINTFLLTLLVLLGMVLQERMYPPVAAATGFVLGLLLLTRPQAIGYLPILLAWLWQSLPAHPRRLLVVGAAVTLATLATILPWTVRNYAVHGQFVFIATNGGFNLWNGNNPFTTGSGQEVYTERLDRYLGVPHDPKAPEILDLRPYPLPQPIQAQLNTLSETELDRQLRQAAFAFARENPDQVLRLALTKLTGFLWFRANVGSRYAESWLRPYQVIYAGLLAIALPGVCLSLRRWRSYLLLYLLLAYYTLSFVAFHVYMRFRWEIEPFLLVFAALTVAALPERLPARRLNAGAST